ncbi:SGNH/GDSL hydrolase family protein [Novosphingobium sp.]|uniref:SGNH/GDSL hydrolase family protein n=1 Tax=Novosphingobium sp. TaxID=1874826 RepID=UPI0038BC7223
MPRLITIAAIALAAFFPATLVARPVAGTDASQNAYVAMGSSFAAGPWVAQDADTPPNRCARSVANYAHLLAARLKMPLVDVSCSGAKAVHILSPWSELPAQINAVTARTRLVTITAGGNDLNYIGSIAALNCGRMTPEQINQAFQGKGCPAVALPTAADEAALASTLRKAVSRIRAAAPRARIVLVQYFNLFSGAPNCAATGLVAKDLVTLQGIAGRLAMITASVAHETGAELLPLDQLSREHGVCSAAPWVNGNSADRANGDGVFYHPNRAGMAAAADALAQLIAR